MRTQPSAETTTAAILDAARRSVVDFGVRGATLSEVARRAGVSRMTVYRRYPDGAALLRALMTEEFGSLFARIAAEREVDHGRESMRERMVTALVEIVRAMRANPLFRRIAESEPELLLPYMLERIGETQRIALVMIEDAVEEGQAEGSIRDGDSEVIAHSTMLIVQSFVLSAGIAERVSARRMLAELEDVLDGALAPRQAPGPDGVIGAGAAAEQSGEG